MTSFQDELIALMREKGIRQADIVRKAGLSSGWVSSMVRNGRIPSRETVLTLAEGLKLGSQDRGRLLRAAGYAEATAEGSPLPPDVAPVVQQITALSPKQLETVRRLLDRPEQIDALAALWNDRRPSTALALA